MEPGTLVGEAASWFNAGDTARFAQCFAEDVTIYWEPEVSRSPAIGSREQLEAVLERIDAAARTSVQISAGREFGKGVVADTILVTEDVWRLALAVLCSESEITEVRAFRDSREAEAWLSEQV